MNIILTSTFYLSFLVLLIATYMPWGYAKHEAKIDYIKFLINGSRDTLKESFHAENLFRRILVCLFFTFIFTLGMHYTAHFSWWFALVYIFYFAALFNYKFTTDLNERRGLDKWYVSRDAHAANYDQTLVAWAKKMNVMAEQVNRNLNTIVFFLAVVVFYLWILIEYFNPNWLR